MTTLSVAGWRIRLACESPALAAAAAARYAAFLEPDRPASAPNIPVSETDRPASAPNMTVGGTDGPDLTVDVRIEDGPDRLAGAGPDPLRDARLVLKHDIYLLDAAAIRGTIALNRGRAALTIGAAAPAEVLEYFLRVAYALVAFHGGGLLVHAAALAGPEGVFLFTGGSGSGKSTVVALVPEAAALGDDLILLRPGPAGWRAYGTPFWNPETADRQGQTGSGPLVRIYRLVQDRDLFEQPLPPVSAAAELLANCPIVNGEPSLAPALLARCRQLAGAVPVAWLHFRRDRDFWGLITAGQR